MQLLLRQPRQDEAAALPPRVPLEARPPVDDERHRALYMKKRNPLKRGGGGKKWGRDHGQSGLSSSPPFFDPWCARPSQT